MAWAPRPVIAASRASAKLMLPRVGGVDVLRPASDEIRQDHTRPSVIAGVRAGERQGDAEAARPPGRRRPQPRECGLSRAIAASASPSPEWTAPGPNRVACARPDRACRPARPPRPAGRGRRASRPSRVAIVPRASSTRLAVASSPPASASRKTPRRSSSRPVVLEQTDHQLRLLEAVVHAPSLRIAAPKGSAFTTPATPPASTSAPSGTSRRSTASAIDPCLGDTPGR